jgi:hypothetical protein
MIFPLLVIVLILTLIYALVQQQNEKQITIEAIRNGCEQRVVYMCGKDGKSYTALAWVKKEELPQVTTL